MKYIGVTGTNGKTSTVQFIYQMLTGMGRKAAVSGTLGLQYDGLTFDTGLTTPSAVTLQHHIPKMESAGVEYLVMEVSSHSLIQNRVDGIRYDVGVFTNLTQDHLDYHGDFESYKGAKRRLLNICEHMVFNIDDDTGEEFFEEFSEREGRGKCITISALRGDADINADRLESSLQGIEFLCSFLSLQAQVKVPVLGGFSVYNVMSAMGALYLLGFDFDDILAALHSVEPVCGRAQIIPLEENFMVMIDYAHTPDALENILLTVKEISRGRIITLFGCGGNRDRNKRAYMGEVVAKYSDFIYLTSDNPRTEDPLQIITDILPAICKGGKAFEVIVDREEAIVRAVRRCIPDDLLILAGKGHEKYQIVGTEKRPFDEEKIVRKALKF